jgi:hypothetical protein
MPRPRLLPVKSCFECELAEYAGPISTLLKETCRPENNR